MKVKLFAAISAATMTYCEGYEVEGYEVESSEENDMMTLGCSDEHEWVFKDQKIDLVEGATKATDIEGEICDLSFYLSRPMIVEDI